MMCGEMNGKLPNEYERRGLHVKGTKVVSFVAAVDRDTQEG
jgi:hypothetical protein